VELDFSLRFASFEMTSPSRHSAFLYFYFLNMKQLIQKILLILSRIILKKYQPEIIGVTGSVGKSSTREAIFAVLSSEFNVRQSEKNYNTELGVPLTIIGARSGGKSILGWLAVILRALSLIIFTSQSYPKILILEMAADHIGDIKYLTSLAPCHIGVVTTVGESHLEQFGTVENIQKEKQTMITHLGRGDYAILNADDQLVFAMKEKTKAKALTFGFAEGADVQAMELSLVGLEKEREAEENEKVTPSSYWEGNEWGVNFKLSYKGSAVPVFLPRVLGKQQVYAALAGATAGLIYKLNLVKIAEALKSYEAPRGRMNLVAGIKHTMLVDDTYNASPLSTVAALEVVGGISLPLGARKFAVLGDMLELGSYNQEGHKLVGRKVKEFGFDFLVAVGERAKEIINGAESLGFPEDKIMHFDNAMEAGLYLQDTIKPNDLILIKGSQGMRMEKITKELMAEPLKAEKLLVRQDKFWLKN